MKNRSRYKAIFHFNVYREDWEGQTVLYTYEAFYFQLQRSAGSKQYRKLFFFSKTTMKQSYVGFPIKRKKKKRKVTCIRIFTLCCILAQFPYMAQCKRRRSPPWSLQDGGPNPWPIFMQTSYNCEENKKTKQSERSVLTSFIN